MDNNPAEPCVPNPDVAGLGVIVSFLVSTGLTYTITTICACLRIYTGFILTKKDAASPNELPLSMLRVFREDTPFWEFEHQRATLNFWHRVLSKILLGLGLNQLVGSAAFGVSSCIVYGAFTQEPHGLLASNLSLVYLLSQLPIPFVVQQQTRKGAAFRAGISVLSLGIILGDMAMREAYFLDQRDWTKWLVWLLVVCLILSFGILALLLVYTIGYYQYPWHSDSWLARRLVPILPLLLDPDTPRLRLSQLIRPPLGLPFIVTGMVSLLSLRNVIAIVRSKFGNGEFSDGCDLNSAQENQWSLGQILSVLMLLALVLPACDAYWEESDFSEETSRLALPVNDEAELSLIAPPMDANVEA